MNKVTCDGIGDIKYDAKGKPAEIEILNASKFMGELLSTIIKAKTGEKQLEITA